jgi:hypothetical protein
MEQICDMPVAFRRGSKSPIQLLEESGYFEMPNELTIEALAAFIGGHPSVIQVWLRWSEDKRVSSGWYFVRKAGGYIVGQIPNGLQLPFSDDVQACAEFVVREVAAIASQRARQ